MSDDNDIERARVLAQELQDLCEALGDNLAGDFVYAAIERLDGHRDMVLREDLAPWPTLQ